jgi:Zn-dependent protease with chaperone function
MLSIPRAQVTGSRIKATIRVVLLSLFVLSTNHGAAASQAAYDATTPTKDFCYLRVNSPGRVDVTIATNLTSPAIIYIQFGYSRHDVLRMILPLLVLLILPVVLTLYMRRAVLRKPDVVRSGAWFGYWRFLQWNTLGTYLLWVAAVGSLKLHSFLQFLLGANAGASLESVIETSIYVLPPFLINILCRVLSHRVFVEVQQAEWTQREVFQQAVWSQMATFVPLAMFFTGVSLVDRGSFAWGSFTLLAALVVMVFSARRLRRVMNHELQAVSTGELRDRAFALAEKARVKLQQVYVMPTRKARMANALARRGNSIIVTDYLLEHLSKREVDGVLAHELGHLIKGNRSRGLRFALFITFVIAVFVMANLQLIFRWLPEGSVIPLVILLFVPGFYVMTRQRERRADRAAVKLTGDAEGLIRAIAKVTTLNRMPIQWGRLQGKLLSHPSTLHRAQAMARQAGIPEERLTQILASPEEALDHYSVPPTSIPSGKAFSTTFKTRLSSRLGWSLTAVSILTPALVAFVATQFHWPLPLWSILTSGFLATIMLALWITNTGPAWGSLKLKRKILERMRNQGLAPDAWGGVFVGFSPDPFPRLYELNYAWDAGFLVIAGDRLCYLGEETRFALRRDQITKIRPGPGHPSWWPSQRIYISWKDEEKRVTGTFNFVTKDSPSMRKAFVDTVALGERLQTWYRESSLAAGTPSEITDLGSQRSAQSPASLRVSLGRLAAI